MYDSFDLNSRASNLTILQQPLFGNGCYRVFFKVVINKNSLQIYLLHIRDSSKANLEVYSNNTLPTYDDED